MSTFVSFGVSPESFSLGVDVGVGVIRDYKLKQCVYYETTKVDLNKRLIYECRCDERLKV